MSDLTTVVKERLLTPRLRRAGVRMEDIQSVEPDPETGIMQLVLENSEHRVYDQRDLLTKTEQYALMLMNPAPPRFNENGGWRWKHKMDRLVGQVLGVKPSPHMYFGDVVRIKSEITWSRRMDSVEAIKAEKSRKCQDGHGNRSGMG